MQYTEIFSVVKIEKFRRKTKTKQNLIFFNIFAQNTDYGYTLEFHFGGSNKYPQSMFWIEIEHTLEPPHVSGSNEYPQSMFWVKVRKYYY